MHRECVQSVMVYGSKTWALRVEDIRRLERTEMMMVKMMCGVTLKQRLSNKDLLECMGIANVSNVMRITRLRWLGQVERMPAEHWVSRCRSLVVDGTRGRGSGRKTWSECLMGDTSVVDLKAADARDRRAWKQGIMRKPSDLRKRGTNTR